MKVSDPFRYFKSSHEIIRYAVWLYSQFPLSLRHVEDLLHERGIDITYETVRFWHDRFAPLFAIAIRRRRKKQGFGSKWRWHLDEVFVKINGKQHYLWRAVDHEGEVLECYVTLKRNRAAALRFLKKAMKKYGKIGQMNAKGKVIQPPKPRTSPRYTAEVSSKIAKQH